MSENALADRIGLSATQLSRGAAAGTFSLVNLLRLAIEADAHPRDVLKLAGKDEEAALLERAFGLSGDRLSPAEQQVVRDLRVLDAPIRDSFLRLIHDCVPVRPKKHAGSASTENDPHSRVMQPAV